MNRVRYQAAIVEDDRILMLKVWDHAHSGHTFWLIPGGGREPGWDPLALNDPITSAKLHQMRLALGYVTEAAPLTVREATMDDVEFLVSVNLLANEARCAARPDWNAERALERMTAAAVKQIDGMEEHSMTYVIESDRTPVGRLRLVRPGDRLHLAGIQIHPAHQRKGIGSSVLSDPMQEADENALPLTLEVDKDNPDAMRLYLRSGFEVIEERGEKDLMEKHVSAGSLDGPARIDD